MHLHRGILRMYRQSYGLSMVPDDQNTLTCQSADKNDSPRDPLLFPITEVIYLHFGLGIIVAVSILHSFSLPVELSFFPSCG